jgi:serine/threonine-protein kinase
MTAIMSDDSLSLQYFICPHCQIDYFHTSTIPFQSCPFCHQPLPITEKKSQDISNQLGPYQLLKSIGKGGMGEVFLAYDRSCGRQIALKQIRSDLKEYPQIYHRLLKEARITSQLTHPAIIPIYTIHQAKPFIYYTMPFVEGETLKQIIRKTRQQEKRGEKLDHIGGSIPALIRIFMTICQAVAYAHSKNVLHRDLKLENIIIGKYGEVLILDWGLAKLIDQPAVDEEMDLLDSSVIHLPKQSDMTRTGKVVGTIAYMAPERALGQPATVQTDIYSLGVILYYLLTLQSPFKRGDLEEFRQTMKKEKLVDPVVMAPYRDVPRILSSITQKCLAEPLQRYSSVDELIHDIGNYIEGRSEWFHLADLDIHKKEDWEFQENILLAEHVAVTRIAEETEWVSLMISSQSFAGNTKLETEVCLGENSHGIGFLISVPEAIERQHITDGYCLWLGTDRNRSTKLLRSTVEVMQAPDIFLKHSQWHVVRIEKIEQTLHIYIDDVLQFSYIAYLPLIGTHVGLLSRDADFEIRPIRVFVRSINIMVSCLAVPDAFLAHQDFNQALSEYRRIAYSFPDRLEGRQAIFRAGLTFIEQAKESSNKEELLDQALEEFEKLHGTPSAPLEYLGKALVYQTLQDYAEEIKCFELAYRRYPKHPLLPMLQEQILARMHELSRIQRIAAYEFVLLAVRHLPLTITDTHTRKLFNSLQKHWEVLPFIEERQHKEKTLDFLHFAIQLAFWLAKPHLLGEMIDQLKKEEVISEIEFGNACFCLIELGCWEYAQSKINDSKHVNLSVTIQLLQQAIDCHHQRLEEGFNTLFSKPVRQLNFEELRTLFYCLNVALDQNRTHFVYEAEEFLQHDELSLEDRLRLNVKRIWAYLIDKNWQAAGELIYAYPLELLNKESSPLYFLYGCWLQATEGKEMADVHFTGALNVSYPRSWTLASHYLIGNIHLEGTWFQKAFLWEKRQLYRQLILYYHCAGEQENMHLFQHLYSQTFIYVR